MATVDVRAAAVAVHGIATDDALVEAGISRRTIRRRVADGSWERLARGVIRLWPVPGPLPSILAAVLAGPGGTVASHVTAAVLHDLGGFDQPPLPHVTVPRGLRYLDLDCAVVHTTTRTFAPGTVVDEVPVTPVPRTLRDLAGSADVPPRMLHRAVRDAFRNNLCTVDEALAEAEPRGHGRRRLRETVERERRTTGQRTESRLERGWADALLDAGIDGFVTQHEVTDAGRTVRLDIAWPDQRIAVEVDGARYHDDAMSRVADAERTAWLETRGWTVIRVTVDDLSGVRRQLALDEVRRALAASARAATNGRIA